MPKLDSIGIEISPGFSANAPASKASKREDIATPTNTNKIIMSEFSRFTLMLSPMNMNNNMIIEANSGLRTRFSEDFR